MLPRRTDSQMGQGLPRIDTRNRGGGIRDSRQPSGGTSTKGSRRRLTMAQSLNVRVAEYRKTVTAVGGGASLAVSQGVVQGGAAKWTGLGIGLLTALGGDAVGHQAATVPRPDPPPPPL